MKETPENTVSKRIFGEWYVDLSDELQESVHRIIALVEEESRIQAFNEGIAPVRAQAKAEKTIDAHPYAWAIKGPGIKADEMCGGGAESPEVDPEHEARSAARREAFEALRNIMRAGDNHDRILACRVALETNQW